MALVVAASSAPAGYIDEDGYYVMDSLELSGFHGSVSSTGRLHFNGGDGTISGISTASNSWWLQFEKTDMSKLPSNLAGALGWKMPHTNTSAGGLQLILVVSTAANGWQAGPSLWLNAGQTGTVRVNIQGPETMYNYWIIASVPNSLDVLTFTALGVENKAKPWNPAPKDDPGGLNATVLPEVVVRWNTAMVKDPTERPNPAVRKHYVFGNFAKPTDPNLYYIGEVGAGSPVGATAQYPASGTMTLAPLTTYKWRIVEGLDDGKGGVFPHNDPNNIIGNVWTFKTASYNPIVTKSPAYRAVFPGSNTTFTAEFFSLTAVTGHQWFWSGNNGATYTALVNGAHPSGSGSLVAIALDVVSSPKTTRLSIVGAGAGDDGLYYCAVTNAEGSGQSVPAGLAVKRQVAYYPFENSLNDASGHGKNGIAKNSNPLAPVDVTYAAGVSGSAVLLNSTVTPGSPDQSYIELPLTGYPKAGPGGAMEAGTLLCWVKTNNQGRIMGSLNSGATTAFTAGLDTNFDVFIRDSADTVNETVMNRNLVNGQWQFVAARWEVGGLKRAYTGTLSQNGVSSAVEASPEAATYAALVNPMLIGAQNNAGVPGAFLTNATIDELKIYNYALTDAEIAAIYNAVSGRGLCAATYLSPFDFNGDCVVGLSDFAEFAGAWLSCGVLPASACGN